MAGFFPTSAINIPDPVPLTPRCGQCGLYRNCKSPRMAVTGEGKLGVLIVAEAPGEQEDAEGIQLVGKSGQLLRKALSKQGIDLDRDCWKTNAVICRPPKNEVSDVHIESCRPTLNQTIEKLNPHAIVLLGGTAVKSLIGQLWRVGEDPGPIGRWVGWQIPSQQLNAWVCPTYHPAYLLRANEPAIDLWFGRHLASVFGRLSRPWKEIPDFSKQVECIYESDKAAGKLKRMIEYGGTIAFDYETNMLKPDDKDARIVCCSVCWEGKKTIAFPWHGEAVTTMSELLRSPAVKKVGANIKFEERWTRKILGHGVRGWVWDDMVSAHVLDNRPGITSVKFQSFVRLGQPSYETTVGPYLKAVDGNKKNRIDEVDLGSLLLYCGLDSLLEWKIAEGQNGP